MEIEPKCGMDEEELSNADSLSHKGTLTNTMDEGIERDNEAHVWMDNTPESVGGCRHRLSDQEIDESRICQPCRKKTERLKALRMTITNETGLEASFWSSARLSPCDIVTPDKNQSPSMESPSSPVQLDRGLFAQRELYPQITNPTINPAINLQPDNRHRLTSHIHNSGGDHSSTAKGDQLPQKQQQALIQKLQGALNKVSPKMFKTKKTDRPLPVAGTQDQKILALMWAKKEEEERQKLLRELSHRQWEEEMKATTSSSRGSSFRRRKQTGDLSTPRRKDKLTLNAEDNGFNIGSQAPCSAHGVSHKSNDAAVLEEGRSEGVHENPDKEGKTLSNYQLDRQHQNSKEKQIQAMQRKKSVEQRLEQQRREKEQHVLELKKKQEQDIQRANSVRISREQQQILRTKLKNLEAQQKQERINQMRRQSMMDLSQKEEEIQNKLCQADMKVQRLKHEEAMRRRNDLKRRIEQSRQRQEQIENEQRKWQDELLKYQKWKDYQADSLAKESVAKKRNAACSERIKKEQIQRDNMKRLLSQEEQWLNDVESSIALKDARIKTVQKEKEEHIQKSRAMASAYQRMREELKTHYSMNDLDQVAKKVFLENRLAHKEAGSNVSPSFTDLFTHNSSATHLEAE